MKQRTLAPVLRSRVDSFPLVFLTGPRQSGKTTLARGCFPGFGYFSLEDPLLLDDLRSDPRGFVDRLARHPGVVLDEVQNAPALFSFLQQPIDERRLGPVILTGSQNFLLSQHISQTLAGRASVVELLPFSRGEILDRPALPPEPWPGMSSTVDGGSWEPALWMGGYPPLFDRRPDAAAWFEGYVRTYLERDVRSLANVGDLQVFQRFLRLCAGRSGQLVNASGLAADAGIDHTTARRWLSILEASYVAFFLPPHHANFNKRVVKTPKLYFYDTGLLCWLLGIRSPSDLETHPLRGALFETWVVGEVWKRYLHAGIRPPLYFWRDQTGHEVDLLIDRGTDLLPIEIKSGESVTRDALGGVRRFLALAGVQAGGLIYGGGENTERDGVWVRSWAHVT